MAYVQPDSKVIICSDTGLAPDSPHTYRFTSRSQQYDFFYSKKIFDYQPTTYIRWNEGYVKVECSPWKHRWADYMMIENRNDNLWMYAFITNCFYVNENTAVFTFQIDYLQTYFFRLFEDMEYMYIERETVENDFIFGNTLPEPVSLGSELIYDDLKWSNINVKATFQKNQKYNSATGVFGGWLPIITRPKANPEDVEFISGIITPLNSVAFKTYISDVGATSSLQDYLKNMEPEDYQEIVDFCMYPESLLDGTAIKFTPKTITESVTIPGRGLNPWEDDGFVPRNNKLFTSPFCRITVTNGCGQAIDYAPQYFKDGLNTATFYISGTYPPNPEFYCAPRNYGGSQAEQPQYTLTLSGVPKIPIVTDAYKVYMSQTAASRALANTKNALDYGMGTLESYREYTKSTDKAFGASNPYGSINAVTTWGKQAADFISGNVENVKNAYISVEQLEAQVQDAKHLAMSTNAGTAPNALYIQGTFGFHGYITKIDVEYAKIADNFFTMFGYAVKDVRKPNIFSRKNWNYLKGTQIVFNHRVSTEAKLVVANRIANGITFWNPAVTMGDYSIANPKNI